MMEIYKSGGEENENKSLVFAALGGLLKHTHADRMRTNMPQGITERERDLIQKQNRAIRGKSFVAKIAALR